MRTGSTEVRVSAAVTLTAALFSPRMRGMLRRGTVQGLAGVLTASDAITEFARGVSRGMQEQVAPPAHPPLHLPEGPQVPTAAAAWDPVDGTAGWVAAEATTVGAAVTGTAASVAPRARKRRSSKPQAAPAAASDAPPSSTVPVADPAEGARE